MIPYGKVKLCRYWFRSWLFAWRHQAITWTKWGNPALIKWSSIPDIRPKRTLKSISRNRVRMILIYPHHVLRVAKTMMTSSNGNLFRVTGHLCGEFTGPGEFPAQRPVTRSFDVFFDLRLNKRLSKQSWCWWFETLSRPLWRHCNAKSKLVII